MKKWKVDSNSARKIQVCSPIKPLAAEKNYNFAGLCYQSFQNNQANLHDFILLGKQVQTKILIIAKF
jgi:hypothetical protein